MVKIVCPVCGGTGWVSGNFGCPPCPPPCPRPWYQPSIWYNTTTSTTGSAQTQTAPSATQSNYYYTPTTTTTSYWCPQIIICLACGGTGIQECDCHCHCHCCRHTTCVKYKRHFVNPCPSPYISSQNPNIPNSCIPNPNPYIQYQNPSSQSWVSTQTPYTVSVTTTNSDITGTTSYQANAQPQTSAHKKTPEYVEKER